MRRRQQELLKLSYFFSTHASKIMKIIAITEITPLIAKNTGCSIPRKGRLRIPAIIAKPPTTKAVISVTGSPLDFESFFGFETIMKPIPIRNSHKKSMYDSKVKLKKLVVVIFKNPIIETIAKMLPNPIERPGDIFFLRIFFFAI